MDETHSQTLTSSFNDEPLDALLDKKVHEMTPTELAEYVKWMSTLRSSAQTRKAALRNEGNPSEKKQKKPKSPPKDSATLAQELLTKLMQGK